MDEPTVGELFAGIGGIGLGLERAGFRVAWHVEIDPFCRHVLEHRRPGVPTYGDIKAIDWRTVAPVDLLAGGFPCQPISSAGKQLAQADDRWLWPEFARAIRDLRPRYVLVENVRNLLVVNHGGVFGEVLGGLASLGYDAEWDCIPASAVGAPHRRDRVWIVGYRGELGPSRRVPDAGGSQLRIEREWVDASEQGHRPPTESRHDGPQEPVADTTGSRSRVGGPGHERRGADAPSGGTVGRRSQPRGDGAVGGAWALADADGGRRPTGQGQPVAEGQPAIGGSGRDVPDADRLDADRGRHGAGAVRGQRPAPAGLLGGAVPDTEIERLPAGPREQGERPAPAQPERPRTEASDAAGRPPADGGGVVPDAVGEGLEGPVRRLVAGPAYGRSDADAAGSDWWTTEPDVGRVAHGVPARVDRLRALGNAVVPQVVEGIGRSIRADMNR